MSNHLSQQRSAIVKALAAEHGFDFCGISKADFLASEAPRLETWLKKGAHGQMRWMENHFDKRLDPRLLVPGAQSVVSFLFNYFPEQDHLSQGEAKISRYAYGEDYHDVLKRKMRDFIIGVEEKIGTVGGRLFVDSAPVMDKAWAARSGLGWTGKHTNLINREIGSYFFIAEWITELVLEPDGPIADYCGTCTRCQDACPTGALDVPYQIDASRCISYLTIELREAIPAEFKGKTDNWVFGCDICQEVCPWNRFAKPHKEMAFQASTALEESMQLKREEWTEELFNSVFAKSPIKRTGFQGWLRNGGFEKE